MTSPRPRLALATAAGLVALIAAGGSAVGVPESDGPRASSDAATAPGWLDSGTPGYCPDKTGVTVVVDFNQLGGGIVIRCAPGPVGSGYTGLDALQDAGFAPEGTKRWGLQFICRIAGKPAPDQKLHIRGDRNYRESCVDTPPPEAFWGYWYAPNGGTWTFSSEGPMNRDVIPGGFEGWSFSLNHSQDTAPPPGVAPKRPRQPPPTSPPPTSPPTSSPPTHTHPTPTQPTRHGGGGSHHGGSSDGSNGGSGGSGDGSAGPPVSTAPPPPTASTGSTHHAHPAPGRTASAYGSTLDVSPTTPTDNPLAVGHNAAGEKVSGTLPQGAPPSGGSPNAAIAGILVLAVLAAGGFVAWRRRAGPR